MNTPAVTGNPADFDPDHELREWLEADGRGGFASGCVSLARSRRYHALLLAAARPPVERYVLVNGCDAEVITPEHRFPLSAQRYAPNVVAPAGWRHLTEFRADPWPTWRFVLPDGLVIEQEICALHGESVVAIRWRITSGPRRSSAPDEHGGVTLEIRPFLSGRDIHALHRENPAFRFAPETSGTRLRFQPYPGIPVIDWLANGRFTAEPEWYRQFHYAEEARRGFPAEEDLASPGRLSFALGREDAVWILAAGAAANIAGGAQGDAPRSWLDGRDDPARALAEIHARERSRRLPLANLARAGDAYLVRGTRGPTVVAGYPWFADWGRDTFISLRGLCLATGRLDEATAILTAWTGALSEGMLPNRFPDDGSPAEYNSVDAALWFVIAAAELENCLTRVGRALSPADTGRLGAATRDILAGYLRGTRHGIRVDADGLLGAGEPGVQLTWMDARVDGRVITPRIGKPVEIQALWVNALRLASATQFLAGDPAISTWIAAAERCTAAFSSRFWSDTLGHLHDVVDAEHRPGQVDSTLRPNQILAVGGLPFALLEGERARAVVDRVAAELWTPLGLRSLAPSDPAYRGHYAGGPAERDGAYHQGTVWPWLAGPFIEAWVRTHGNDAGARAAARDRYFVPLLAQVGVLGVGHLPEVADGDPPHHPGGCPFQAWSIGEALRIDALLGS